MATPQKKITANLKLRLQAGHATPAPPVGSILGQYGVNMMDFINPFNEQTKDMNGIVTVHVTVFEDRTMKFRVVSEPTDEVIRRVAGIPKGSGVPHTEKVGKLTKAQVQQIAETKLADMNTDDIEMAKRQVAGTARSMGVEVEI